MNLNVLLRGQSNAFLLGLFNGNSMTDRVEALLGFDGVNDTVTLEYQHDTATGNTVYSGTSFLTQWLNPTPDGGWQVGELEQGLLNYVNGLSAAQKAQPTVVVWLHSEYDSSFPGLTPAYWESAVRYDAALVRAAFGQSAATLPYLFVSAIPYNNGTGNGHQAIRMGMEELAADPTFNAGIAARIQDADMTWDNPALYGGSHMSFEDQRVASIRIAASLAEEWAAYAKPGSPVALAGGNIDNLGPQVIAASVSAPNQLTIKVQFDAASSLAPLDLAAAQGVGWTIIGPDGKAIDGGAAALAIGTPDTMYVSFDGLIPAGSKLYYGWGYGRLEAADGSGQGHAVYDNAGLPIWVDAHGLAIGTTSAVVAPTPMIAVSRNGVSTQEASTTYSGPVAYIEFQYLGTVAGEAVVGTASNDFVNLFEGDDAAQGGAGDDVLDGGTGSNFLTGGSGWDVFFLDGRGGQTTWATITDWQPGEQVSIWGWRPGVSRTSFAESDGTAGYKGATLHVDLDGNGVIDTSITAAGILLSQVPTPLEFDGLLWIK